MCTHTGNRQIKGRQNKSTERTIEHTIKYFHTISGYVLSREIIQHKTNTYTDIYTSTNTKTNTTHTRTFKYALASTAPILPSLTCVLVVDTPLPAAFDLLAALAPCKYTHTCMNMYV